MELIVRTPSEAFSVLARHVVGSGATASPRGMLVHEVENAQIVITEPWQIPLDLPGRNLRQFIGAAEGVQLVGQFSSPELMTRVQAFAKFADHGVFHGAYGIRVHGRIGDLVDLLKHDPDSRQAVLSIYDSGKDLGRSKRDIPCTIAIQFLLRRGKLNMRVAMRSNDLWLGFPYDVVQFGALQGAIAQALGVEMGTYTHSVGSLHLYDQDVDKVGVLSPVRQESRPYEPLWSASDIDAIASTARKLAAGIAPERPTAFETFLAGELA